MSAEKLITENLELWTSTVKAKKTQGRGSNSKRELYGIKKLRELILELAVRGKLVPQDPKDEPANVLLERIAEKKEQLIKGRKTKELPEVLQGEGLFDLPHNWKWTRLGNIGFTQTGGTPKKSDSHHYGQYMPFVKPGDIIDGSITSYTNDGLSEVGVINLDRVAPAGSVLMVCIGTIGKCAFIDRDCSFNQQINSVTPYERIGQFIHTSMSSMFFQRLAWKHSSSTTLSILNKSKWENLPIPIAPVEEQIRIVAKVKELMALCDQLEQQTEASLDAHQQLVDTLLATLTSAQDAEELKQNWARLSEHFDTLITTDYAVEQLKQTILQLAVMGKLVPQDPNDEPASVLLERIAAEKAQLVKEKKIKKQKPLPMISNEEKPFDLPIGWEWCRLPDVGELARGKSKHRPRNDPALYTNGHIPLVQTGDVSRANGIIETYSALYNKVGLAQSQIWPKGTMCITIAANIADTSILGFDACFPDSVVGYTPFYNNIEVRYFEYFIRTAKNHLEEYAPSTAQKNINLEILSQLLVPCPPINEIARIVARVDSLIDICDQLRTNFNKAQTIQILLTDTMTDEALS